MTCTAALTGLWRKIAQWFLGVRYGHHSEVYFVGDLLLNKKGFDWPVGTTALAAWQQRFRVSQRAAMEKLAAQVIALSVQVFVFAGQATKDKTDKTDKTDKMGTKPIGSGQAVNRL